MSWNKWIRQTHRWLSVLFTLVIVVNGVAVLRGKYTNSLGLMAVFVLTLMFLTGAYLFVLPYVPRGRSKRRTA